MDTVSSSAELLINKIQTFVFFDLETTGLAGMDTRILELSMIAVSREDLLNMKKTQKDADCGSESSKSAENVNISSIPALPRVLHKYTRLYYPRKIIYPKLEEITGLSNELLHRLPGFSPASAEAINLFLDLPKPVTLVAHNGSRYDFPLLKAELTDVFDISNLKCFKELLCADTLTAIKDIDASMQFDREVKEITEITMLASSFKFDELDDEEMDLVPECKKARSEESEEVSGRVSTPPSPEGEGHINDLISPGLPITPMKDQISLVGLTTPKTPVKAKMPPKPPITPESNGNTSTSNGISNVRRSLTYGGKKRKWDGTQPYKQVNIYKRLFGGQYDAHRAEADCLAMLEICGHYSEKFIDWADLHSYKFTSVKPMWERRKSFQIN